MVEVLILFEPLSSKSVLIGVLESLVDWSQVLQAALGRDEIVGRVVSWLILEAKAQRKPSLLNLGIRVSSRIEISIDLSKDSNVALVLMLEESGVEDRLQV